MIQEHKVINKFSNDFIVLGKIYEYEKVRKEPIWFSKLVELLDGKLDLVTPAKNTIPPKKEISTRIAISMCHDKLYDIGMIDTKYEMVDRMWTCCWHLEDDALYLAKSIYKNMEKEK